MLDSFLGQIKSSQRHPSSVSDRFSNSSFPLVKYSISRYLPNIVHMGESAHLLRYHRISMVSPYALLPTRRIVPRNCVYKNIILIQSKRVQHRLERLSKLGVTNINAIPNLNRKPILYPSPGNMIIRSKVLFGPYTTVTYPHFMSYMIHAMILPSIYIGYMLWFDLMTSEGTQGVDHMIRQAGLEHIADANVGNAPEMIIQRSGGLYQDNISSPLDEGVKVGIKLMVISITLVSVIIISLRSK